MMLLGADIGLVVDVLADEREDLLVGKDIAPLVGEEGAIAVDGAGDLRVGILREAEEGGDKAAENQSFSHVLQFFIVLYHTNIVILAGKSNPLAVFKAGLIFVRKSPRKHKKRMKKVFSILLAASLMLLGTQAFAQMSVNAGYLNSTQSFKDSNSKSINSNGAYAGVSFNIPLAGAFGIAPGLYYSMITNKSGGAGSILGIPVSASSTFMEHAINVPLYASTTKLAGGVGESSADRTYNNYDNENYNRFNVYLGGGIGFQVSAIQITVGYDYGMMNLYKGDNAAKTHRSNLKLGLGFVF